MSYSGDRLNDTVTMKPAPQRTCIACRRTKSKRELLRLVRTPNGDIEVDHKYKKAGRGAYLCPAKECWDLTLGKDRRNRMAHALKVKLTEPCRITLMKYAVTLPEARVEHRKELNDS